MVTRAWAWVMVAGAAALGCKGKPAPTAAPVASSLGSAPAPAAGAILLKVRPGESHARLTMEAPIERIHGELPGGLSGEISVDPTDLSRSTALIRADLSTLSLFQQRRDDERQEFGEKKRSDQQNEHARTWLEISDDVPEEARRRNQVAEFRVSSVKATPGSLAGLEGAERKVTASLEGELLVHGRKAPRTLKVELAFLYDGERLTGLRAKTLEPLRVGLEEFDIRPRDAFGRLAQKTLGDLAGKVAREAPVEIELSARAP